MDLEKIAGLVKIIEESSLTQFTIKDGDLKITMSKLEHPPVVTAAPAAAPAASQTTLPEDAVHVEETPEDDVLFIVSPSLAPSIPLPHRTPPLLLR